jgi:hypothetical protein
MVISRSEFRIRKRSLAYAKSAGEPGLVGISSSMYWAPSLAAAGGASYRSVWRGREHRDVRMLHGTVIAGIFFLAIATLAFFLTTATS